MKQLGADMLLQERDRAAHGRRRPAEASARTGETALVDNRHKDLHRVDAIHLFSRLEEQWLPWQASDNHASPVSFFNRGPG
jgi:hypothetical protein